jgi:hypothetical protein
MLQKNFLLITPLSIPACAARLQELTGGGMFDRFAFFGGKPLIGSVDERGFRWRRRAFYQSGFQTDFIGTFSTGAQETVISCRAGMSRRDAIFLAVWFSLAVFVAIRGFFNNGVETGLESTFSAAMGIVIGVALFCVGRFLARRDVAFILNLLAKSIDAREPATAAASSTQGVKPPRAVRSPTVQR